MIQLVLRLIYPQSFRKLLTKLETYCKQKGSHCGGNHRKDVGGDICWERNTKEWPNLNDFYLSFPNFTFGLDGNQEYTLTGLEYMFPEQYGKENHCLGFYELG